KSKASSDVPPQITTPDAVRTSLGKLEFKDGAPNKATMDKVYDNLDLMHGEEAFLNAFRGVSLEAARKGFLEIGAEDNTVVIFSELMDSKSLFLTANADTIYFISFVDLNKGPMVVETPPLSLGAFDDMWFRWVIDFGLPGPDRGAGGRYLLVPPGYKGALPDSGYFVARSRTTRVLLMGRCFLQDNDPKPPVELIKKTLKIYSYEPGGFGTSIATALTGAVPLLRNPNGQLDWAFLRPQAPANFVEGTGKVMNTIPPNDFSYFEMLNELVQQEPADAMNPEVMGSLAAIGIVKGKPFNPDGRMKELLEDAVATANATARTLVVNPRESEGFYFYPGSGWQNSLWPGGYEFETPPPEIGADGAAKPYPTTGARTLNSRTAFFYYATGITPSMIMRMTEIGSQYLWTFVDSDKHYLDGSKTYKVTLPPNIPAAKFWSFTLYDNQSRSMLQTPQRSPRAGSQSFPTPAAIAESDGSTVIYFSPTKPAGVKDGNWIQTAPGRGYSAMLRLYSPLEPFFAKSWRPGEVELVK
ncbi:MAG: DUF1254 domain-containing protein, partial [Terriglobales bacterium]